MGWLDNLRSIARPRDGADGERDARASIEQGNVHEERGDFASALRCYDEAVEQAPALAAAPLNRGNALLAMDRVDEALAAYSAAIALDPSYAAAHFNRGNAQMRLGRRDEAVESYRAAVRLKPDFADAEVALGNAHEEMGQLDDAVASFQRALAVRPEYPEVHANLGHVLVRLGRADDAIASFQRALDQNAELFAAHYGLAQLLRERGRNEEALAHFERCLRLSPDHVDALTFTGDVLSGLGRHAEAIERYKRAIAVDPRSIVAHNNLGNVLRTTGQLDQALDAYRSALALAPDHAELMVNMGAVLNDLGRAHEAVEILTRAIELAPRIALAHFNLGNARLTLRLPQDAAACFRRALEIEPDSADSHCNLGIALLTHGDYAGAVESFRRSLAIDPDYLLAQGNLLVTANYRAEFDAEQMFAEARHYGDMVARLAPACTAWQNDRDPDRRLRVGIVSPDLRAHAAGFFAEAPMTALAADAAAGIDLYGYYNNIWHDEMNARFRAACRGWCECRRLTDDELVQRIRADRIDVLIDLAGHTSDNRLPVFARKPAPVQATWLGYYATTGIATIDYLIADPWTLPPEFERSFTERIWRLPETRLCFTAPGYAIEPGPLPALTAGRVTFGCFNTLPKMTDPVVAAWARILLRMPESRLLLKALQLGEGWVREQVLDRFARCGVDSTRLILEGPTDRADYLAAYHRVDIALDPFPFPGGATSAEALWMGVPVLTLAGNRFIARQGVGLLMNAGLADWVATDVDDYVARALVHAKDLASLAALRARLRPQVLASPAFDATRFARHLATALRGMWREWCLNPQTSGTTGGAPDR